MNKGKFFIWCAVKRHLDSSSIAHTRIRYDYLFRWLGRRKLTAETAEEFILGLRERGLRNATLNGYIRIIRLIDDFERHNEKDSNLLKNIDYFPKQKKIPTILTIEEIESIINAELPFFENRRGMNEERSKKLNATYKNSIWFLAATGCRYEEMASLKVENLQLGLNSNYVIFKNTKTDDDREVPLPPTLSESLKQHIENKKPSDLVFTSLKGNHMAEQTFNPHLRKKVQIGGITNKHVHAHVFRYSFIMEHIKRGTGHLTISKLVGHRDANTTLGYTRYDREELIKGAENHPFFSRNIEPQKLIDKIGEIVERLPTKTDPRFLQKVIKTSKSIIVEIVLSEC